MPDLEVGLVPFIPAEFKFATGDQGLFEGYGSVFDVEDSHGDVVRPGAFNESLAKHKKAGTMPGLYVEHSAFTGGDQLPIGKWLSMSEDGKGLRVQGKLSAVDTDHGRRIRSLMQDGALPGLSIVYSTPPGGSSRRNDGVRILSKVDLHAVDVVTSPSNHKAVITTLKKAPGRFESKAQLEDWLHDVGLPSAFAKKLVRGGWQALAGEDAEPMDSQAILEALRLQRQEISTLKVR